MVLIIGDINLAVNLSINSYICCRTSLSLAVRVLLHLEFDLKHGACLNEKWDKFCNANILTWVKHCVKVVGGSWLVMIPNTYN